MLESLEIAYITEEITNLNEIYQKSKTKIDSLNEEIISLSTVNSTNSSTLEKEKTELTLLEENISSLQTDLIEQVRKVEKINSEKNILLERKKYEVEDEKLHKHLLVLEEESLKIKNNLNKLTLEKNNLLENIKSKKEEQNLLNNKLNSIKNNKNNTENKLTITIRKKVESENQINHLQNMIENNSTLPSSVNAVLKNPKLIGMIDVIGNLIEVDEEYSKCISVALGASSSYIVSENQKSIEEAIKYLKENRLGRATFFPLNIIKSKYIDNDTLSSVKQQNGFINIASNLVKYDTKYKNIVENQLGNIIVVDNITSANIIGKLINHTYRIVTLDGEMFHVGGSVTGGESSKSRNIISLKFDLENEIKNHQSLLDEIKELENKMNEIDYEYRSVEDKIYLVNKDLVNYEEVINNKNILETNLNNELEQITNDVKGTNSLLNNELSKEETRILNLYYEELNKKNEIESKLELLTKKKNDLHDILEEKEFSLKQENSLVNSKNKFSV